jgi:microcin C transport system ATP-binding protein
MRSGEIVESGTTANVREQPSHPYTQQLLKAAGMSVPRTAGDLGEANYAR